MSDKLKRVGHAAWLIVLLSFVAVTAVAQNGSATGAGTSSATGQSQPQQSAPKPGSGSNAKPGTVDTDRKISKEQADELFRSVDEILKFSSNDTGLPIKKEVKRRLTSRDEVEKYLQTQMAEDKDAKRLQRSELVLKKFGLIPPDFNLQSFLVALLREQVAGYYDFNTKTVNLLDWVDPEQQKPVLAHELTHALQDQSFDLGKWMKAGDIDLDNIKQLTWDDIQKDEVNTARQAVIEGSAMVPLLDYMLAPMHESLLSSPEMVKLLKDGMLVGTDQSPQFQNAPIFLKEALTFPYRYGIDFVAELLSAGGKQKAFTGAFTNPPHSSREVMEPQKYLAGEKIPPMQLPDFDKIFKNYERFDVGAMGEFDVAVLIDQYAGVDESKALYPEWRGGYYYAVKSKADATAPLGLMYASRWSNAESAQKFAAIYAKGLQQRYKRVRDVAADTKVSYQPDAADTFTGKHTWLTEQGPVVVEQQGDSVLVTESLDPAITEALEAQVLPAAKKMVAAK